MSPPIASLLGRRGRLQLDDLLASLVVDGFLLGDDAKRVRMGIRAGRATVELHPLVLVANAKLPNQRDPGRPLSLETLTEWLAQRADDWRKPWPNYTMTRYGRKATREGRRASYLRFRRLAATSF